MTTGEARIDFLQSALNYSTLREAASRLRAENLSPLKQTEMLALYAIAQAGFRVTLRG